MIFDMFLDHTLESTILSCFVLGFFVEKRRISKQILFEKKEGSYFVYSGICGNGSSLQKKINEQKEIKK